MMEFIDSLNVWQLAALTFGLRICDVSLGTIKTISVVQGRIAMAVFLGFFEVLIWVTVVSQVISHLGDFPILGVAYAGGYAAGNAIGILLDRLMALGTSVIRIVSHAHGYQIAETIRNTGQAVTTFEGDGRDGHCVLMYVICPRKSVNQVIAEARSVDPNVFYLVESVVKTSTLNAIAKQNPWYSVFKKK